MENVIHNRRVDNDEDWADLKADFDIREGTTYLNHGSWGLTARPVIEARMKTIQELDQQPMDFYLRHLEPRLESSKLELARFLNTDPRNLIFVPNATYGMNVVARSLTLRSGDEILLNNHEYGAVQRIWQRECQEAGACLKVARLPDKLHRHQDVIDCLMQETSSRTRLIVVSHITSPTALILPVKALCEAAAEKGIAVCIDGPHAPAHVPLDFSDLPCAFYAASCHKWLSAPLGSGFLFVSPEYHEQIAPPIQSWGRLNPGTIDHWYDEFTWSGTADPTPFIGIADAIEYLESVGFERFRERTHWMQQQTTQRLMRLTGQYPLGDESGEQWYGTMSHVPLPPGNYDKLQATLWENAGIEVPVINFEDRWYIRVSHHLYNTARDYDLLFDHLQ